MKIRVLAFASAADALGASELELDLPKGARVEDLRRHLDALYPRIEALWSRLAVAVEGELARDDTPLADGVEVAVLPPVSGGSPGTEAPIEEPSAAARPKAWLSEAPLDVEACVAAVSNASSGAVLIFAGTVRDSHQGRNVEKITYSAYREMAEKRLLAIVEELENASPGLRVAIVHRLGEVPAGEASVIIAVSSPHRAESYEASRRALERLKKEVPIWKREHYRDGTARWREEESLTGQRTSG